jgi:hypothetical protein
MMIELLALVGSDAVVDLRRDVAVVGDVGLAYCYNINYSCYS